jgi:hypothetical protein
VRYINADPTYPEGTPDLATLAAYDGVRFVARPTLKPYLDSLRTQGKRSLVVVAKESGDPMQYIGWRPSAWQIGNEPDGPDAGSSWVQTPAEYRALWERCIILPGARFIGGMCSGDVERARLYVQFGAEGLGVHLYTLTPAQAIAKVREYQTLNPHVFITEWHPQRIPAQPGDLEPYEQAFGDVWHAYFCYSNAMVAGFGLPERTTGMGLDVTKEMVAKLAVVGDAPILDSQFIKNKDGTSAEKTMGTKGTYLSSEADGWQLRGPFPAAL